MTPSARDSPVFRQLAAILAELEAVFDPPAKMTLLVRWPEVAEGEIIVTTDDMHDVIAALERLRAADSDVVSWVQPRRRRRRSCPQMTRH
jgi:hypothetical protein